MMTSLVLTPSIYVKRMGLDTRSTVIKYILRGVVSDTKAYSSAPRTFSARRCFRSGITILEGSGTPQPAQPQPFG